MAVVHGSDPGAAEPRAPAREVRAWSSPSAPLIALVAAGILLRLIATLSLWPTAAGLEDHFQVFAASNPFSDWLHPAGYALILAGIGTVTREVAATVILQHVLGVVTALLLWAATRRVTGSRWAGLLPAAVVLLNPDQIFLEHAIMSESWAALMTAIALYAAARVFDAPDRSWGWPLLAGVAAALAVTIRTANLLLVAVVLLALLVRPRTVPAWTRWRAVLVGALGAAAVLLAFATANAAFGQRFGLAPSPGWRLYGAAAQFADCRQFTPPRGTRFLCDSRPAAQRPGAWAYLFAPNAPAPRRFGRIGNHDALLRAWSSAALRAQPLDYARLAWQYLRTDWVPGSHPARPYWGTPLSPQLDWTSFTPFEALTQAQLERFYVPFHVHRGAAGLDALHAVQRAIRFGATALTIATLLVLVGLAVGTRRSRAGVVLFGLSAFSLLLPPALSATYAGRYIVPAAGPMSAGAAVALVALYRRRRGRPADPGGFPLRRTT